MSTDKPKSPPPAPIERSLKDLPAQPVDEKEALGVKGGTAGSNASPACSSAVPSFTPEAPHER